MSLRDYSASYRTSKKGLPRDLSKMPDAITRWPLLVELQYWLSRLQRVRLPHRPSFRFFWNMRVLSVGRFVLECPPTRPRSTFSESKTARIPPASILWHQFGHSFENGVGVIIIGSQCSIITFQLGVGMTVLWQYFDARWKKNMVKIMNSSLLRCFYQFNRPYFITQARDKCQ